MCLLRQQEKKKEEEKNSHSLYVAGTREFLERNGIKRPGREGFGSGEKGKERTHNSVKS